MSHDSDDVQIFADDEPMISTKPVGIIDLVTPPHPQSHRSRTGAAPGEHSNPFNLLSPSADTATLPPLKRERPVSGFLFNTSPVSLQFSPVKGGVGIIPIGCPKTHAMVGKFESSHLWSLAGSKNHRFKAFAVGVTTLVRDMKSILGLSSGDPFLVPGQNFPTSKTELSSYGREALTALHLAVGPSAAVLDGILSSQYQNVASLEWISNPINRSVLAATLNGSSAVLTGIRGRTKACSLLDVVLASDLLLLCDGGVVRKFRCSGKVTEIWLLSDKSRSHIDQHLDTFMGALVTQFCIKGPTAEAVTNFVFQKEAIDDGSMLAAIDEKAQRSWVEKQFRDTRLMLTPAVVYKNLPLAFPGMYFLQLPQVANIRKAIAKEFRDTGDEHSRVLQAVAEAARTCYGYSFVQNRGFGFFVAFAFPQTPLARNATATLLLTARNPRLDPSCNNATALPLLLQIEAFLNLAYLNLRAERSDVSSPLTLSLADLTAVSELGTHLLREFGKDVDLVKKRTPHSVPRSLLEHLRKDHVVELFKNLNARFGIVEPQKTPQIVVQEDGLWKAGAKNTQVFHYSTGHPVHGRSVTLSLSIQGDKNLASYVKSCEAFLHADPEVLHRLLREPARFAFSLDMESNLRCALDAHLRPLYNAIRALYPEFSPGKVFFIICFFHRSQVLEVYTGKHFGNFAENIYTKILSARAKIRAVAALDLRPAMTLVGYFARDLENAAALWHGAWKLSIAAASKRGDGNLLLNKVFKHFTELMIQEKGTNSFGPENWCRFYLGEMAWGNFGANNAGESNGARILKDSLGGAGVGIVDLIANCNSLMENVPAFVANDLKAKKFGEVALSNAVDLRCVAMRILRLCRRIDRMLQSQPVKQALLVEEDIQDIPEAFETAEKDDEEEFGGSASPEVEEFATVRQALQQIPPGAGLELQLRVASAAAVAARAESSPQPAGGSVRLQRRRLEFPQDLPDSVVHAPPSTETESDFLSFVLEYRETTFLPALRQLADEGNAQWKSSVTTFDWRTATLSASDGEQRLWSYFLGNVVTEKDHSKLCKKFLESETNLSTPQKCAISAWAAVCDVLLDGPSSHRLLQHAALRASAKQCRTEAKRINEESATGQLHQ